MRYNWRHIGKRTWSHSFKFLRQPRNHMAITGFSLSTYGRFFIRGKSIDDNLYPYHAVLTTKAKDQRLRGFRRSTTEKLSKSARRNVLTCVLPRDPKHSAFLPTATVLCVSEKTVCFSSMPVEKILLLLHSRNEA